MVERKINLGGDTIKLKFTNKAVRHIDRELGYSMMHIMEKIEKHGTMAPLSLDGLATIIWGGMLHLNTGKTIDQVAEMIPLKLSDYVTVAKKVIGVINEIYGIDDAEVDIQKEVAEGSPGKETAPDGTGKASSG